MMRIVTKRLLTWSALALILALTVGRGAGRLDAATVRTPPTELPAGLRAALQEIDLRRYTVVPRPLQYGYGRAADALLPAWTLFAERHGGQWRLEVDDRLRVPLLVEGQGVPWVPGYGNDLRAPAFGSLTAPTAERLTLEEMATVAVAFIDQHRDLLQVDVESLVFDAAASAGFGQNNRYWTLRFQHMVRDAELGAVPLRGAFLFFRVSHGNLVQFGNQLAVAPMAIELRGLISHRQAVDRVLALIAGAAPVRVADGVRDFGQADRTLQIVPLNRADGTIGHRVVRALAVSSDRWDYELWLDAHTGELVHAIDQTYQAQVRGGIYPTSNTDPEVSRGFPFVTVGNNGTKTTDLAGNYPYSPGFLASATMAGDFVKISDQCGSGSLVSVSGGDIDFGLSAGTDCDSPNSLQFNTHASRSTYYHLNMIKEKARYYLNTPVVTTPWLSQELMAKVNQVHGQCNASWSSFFGHIELFASSSGPLYSCSNTGELAPVVLHEFGHGLDQKTNGFPPDLASAEAYSDVIAFLESHDPCIGANFTPGSACQWGCSPACTGVRDVDVAPDVSPANIETPPADCDGVFLGPDGQSYNLTCPYTGYEGPMGYEGHCESLIASGAVWDMIQGFAGLYGDAGWVLGERLWYESLYSTGAAYQVVAGGQCNPSATVDGCGAGNWYTVLLAFDDDNGNLADGTPHAGLIWNAFNDHGIACGTTPPPSYSTCPVLAAPTLSVGGFGQVTLSWPAVAGAASYRIFRNTFGCAQSYLPIAEVVAPSTSYNDQAVSLSTTYYYVVQAVGTNQVCVSPLSACKSATPMPDPFAGVEWVLTPWPYIYIYGGCPPPIEVSRDVDEETVIELRLSSREAELSYDIGRVPSSGTAEFTAPGVLHYRTRTLARDSLRIDITDGRNVGAAEPVFEFVLPGEDGAPPPVADGECTVLYTGGG